MPGTGVPAAGTPARRTGDRRRAYARAGTLALLLALAFLDPAPAEAQRRSMQPVAPDAPALLIADEIGYDQELGVTTARGRVEVTQGERVLRADTVSYNQRTNVVSASGNVSILDPTGDVVFADYVELTDSMREGIVQNVRVRLVDQSRLAAVSGRRADGNVTAMRKAVYSPCELCAADPTRAPVWQLKAARVTHDQQARQITYKDAWREMFGVPVFYTPYLSHPDGTVPRESGFLAPAYRSSSRLGPMIGIPYYYVLGPDKDLTVEPIFLTKDRPVLAGEYRQHTAKGPFEFSASATPALKRDDNDNRLDGTEWRGHVKGTGRFDINDDWRWGFDAERASDDTYLGRYKLRQRYGFLSSTTLTSRLYTEGFFGRSYASANAYAFQGLRPQDISGLEPVVAPLLDYNFRGEPGEYGGRWSFDANALSIYRSKGTRMQRTSLRGGWSLPHTTSTGEIYTLAATVQGDLYNVLDVGSAADPSRPLEDGVSARLFPQVSLAWRYPLIRRGETFRTVIEPQVSLVAAPNVSRQDRLPNEDSRSVDLDDTTLFRPNRFTGLDRLEGGQRLNYGMNFDVGRYSGGRGTLFVGQSYRLQQETSFPIGSGLEDQASNLVARASFTPHPWLSVTHRAQINKADFAARRSLTGVALGPPALQLAVSHLYVERISQPGLPANIEQVATSLVARVSPHWRIQGRTISSLADADRGLLIAGAALIYEDECILTGIDFTRRNVGNRDNPADTAITFRLVLRNLGEVKTRL